VNMSLGRKSGTRQLKAAVENASAAGLVLVAAAGNGGMCNGKGDSVSYPAAYPEVIAVAATDSSDNRPCWSSTGPDVELAAPGVAVYSAWPHGIATSARDPQPVCEDQDGDGVDEACHFKYGSGTSMSSPHVAGAAALVFSAGAASNGAVRQLLQETATDLGTPGRDAQYGYGLVDAAAAVAAAAG
jgi:subtilisin family serine protease